MHIKNVNLLSGFDKVDKIHENIGGQSQSWISPHHPESINNYK